ncbi:MAG: glycosyltransferase [Microgenomates group bacterium]
MSDFKVTLIITVKNEANTIAELLESIVNQTLAPNEIVFVDGGSTDATVEILKNFFQKHPSLNWQLHQKNGNRSMGRNHAISVASHEWIAVTDAGCVLDQLWLESLVKTQLATDTLVQAGYYKGLAKNSFEMAVVPYVLVMPDRVDEESFLPSTRSMMLHTSVWSAVGGFPEKIVIGEDFYFAKKVRKLGYHIAFSKDAVVGWIPRSDIYSFFSMVKEMASGDATSGEIRKKVKLIFLRYGVVALLILLALSTGSVYLALILFFAGLLYGLWAILKNKKYVKSGWQWLPVLQFVSDIGVILGTLEGVTQRHSQDID